MSGSSDDQGPVVRATSVSLVVRTASSAAAAAASHPPIAEADLSPAVRAFITQSLVNRHAAIGQEMLAQARGRIFFFIRLYLSFKHGKYSNAPRNTFCASKYIPSVLVTMSQEIYENLKNSVSTIYYHVHLFL